MGERYFITGAQGCIGSWIVKTLIERGDDAVVFDRSDDSRRLNAIMSADDLSRVRFLTGDITDRAGVFSALRESEAERVIHLAGLQVPTCKADPVTGALINVVGTLNVFEAAREAKAKVVVYASSAAVYGINDDDAALDETDVCEPSTHYGVFKLTNEGNARIYFLDHGLSSVGLRPLTVYGVNRDTGLTSDPTKAMKSAVLGRPFHIRFSGATDFQYVADTARAFIASADKAPEGAHVFNLHGETLTVDQIASFINEEVREGLITFSGPPIPIAPAIDDSAIRRSIGPLSSTPFREGIRATMSRFAELHIAGNLDTSDL
jgi:nucleoside-diphosphate-sugar epimerase